MDNLKFALRQLQKNPGFTAVAVLTFALGIGANTAIFNVVDAVLLRPLPFHDPYHLALLWGSRPKQNQPQVPLSMPDVDDLREQCRSFEAIGAWLLGGVNITGTGEPEQVQRAFVSANFFSIFGVIPIIGRDFLPAEDEPTASRVAILSHALWQRRFGAD
jgi:hypothetical protein